MRTPAGRGLEFIRDIALGEPTDNCVIWPYARDKDGYAGRVRFDGVTVKVCSIVSKIANGPKPTPRHEVAHNCGNGHLGCVNPKHVRWATHKENCADKVKHGTVQRGEANGFSVLCEAQVREIMRLKGSASARVIAEQYEVSRETVSHIHNGRKWAHLFT